VAAVNASGSSAASTASGSVTVYSINPLVQLDFENNLTNSGTQSVSITQTNAGSQAYVTGKVGSNALQFNSTNNLTGTGNTASKAYVSVPVPNLAPPYTIAFWAYLTNAFSGNNELIEFYQSGANSGSSCFIQYNATSFFLANGQTVLNYRGSPYFQTGSWVHLVTVVTSISTITTYYNGTQASTTTAWTNNWNQLSNSATTVTFNLGWAPYQGTQFGNPGFCGYMDQFVLYNVALNSSQISSMYSSGTVRF